MNWLNCKVNKFIPGKLYQIATKIIDEQKMFRYYIDGKHTGNTMRLPKTEMVVAMYITPEGYSTDYAYVLYKNRIISVHVEKLSKL